MGATLRPVVQKLLPRAPLSWIATGLLAAVLANAVVGDGGVLDLLALRAERTAIAHEVFDMLRENDRLRRRVQALRASPRALEHLARSELGLVRPGEIVYRFSHETVGGSSPEGDEPAIPR